MPGLLLSVCPLVLLFWLSWEPSDQWQCPRLQQGQDCVCARMCVCVRCNGGSGHVGGRLHCELSDKQDGTSAAA